jgi:diguanylate cyclase (GGDEF)-like protein/putative nucleotidyltransferase with HDIG domain
MKTAALVSALGLLFAFGLRALVANAAWMSGILVRRALRQIPEARRDGVAAEWLAELEYIHERRSKFATLLWGVSVYWHSGRQGRVLDGGDESPALLAAASAVRQISDLHYATIEALAFAIDAKDQTSDGHLRRVQLYAAAVAREMGMSEDEINGVKTAALLHDIGKLAVPEHILSKPGPLTPEEFQKVRAHPKVGADIVSAVPFPYPVAPLILYHHERWDGKGFPVGLRAEEIPLGARILSVVDYFDALMAERPYHKALSFDSALAVLRQEAGKALDPTVVATFIELLPSLQVEAARLELAMPTSQNESSARSMQHTATAPSPETGKKGVFEDIALAHREIYALYDIAQTMGTSLGVSDTMRLIAGKLGNLVPFSCVALYLCNETSETLRCHFASGVDADVIQQVAVSDGEGAVGWVARNRRPVVNARPSADLEAAGLATVTALQSALVCPLLFNDQLIGTLCVYHTEPHFYRDDHRRLLDRVSDQAGAVIKNSMLFEQALRDSLTDHLTGLANRQFLSEHLAREVARAERLMSTLSVIALDIDGLKQINEAFGSREGDHWLREIARVLCQDTKSSALCGRWFSDKFVVVQTGLGAEEAHGTATLLTTHVQRAGRLAEVGRSRVTITTGIATYPADADNWQSLVDLALRRTRANKPSAGI